MSISPFWRETLADVDLDPAATHADAGPGGALPDLTGFDDRFVISQGGSGKPAVHLLRLDAGAEDAVGRYALVAVDSGRDPSTLPPDALVLLLRRPRVPERVADLRGKPDVWAVVLAIFEAAATFPSLAAEVAETARVARDGRLLSLRENRRLDDYQRRSDARQRFKAAGLPSRAARALAEAGFRDLEAVRALSDDQLLRVRHVGRGTLEAIRALLESNAGEEAKGGDPESERAADHDRPERLQF